MGIETQYISGFVIGNAFQIHRKVMNPGRPDPVISVVLDIIGDSGQKLLSRKVRVYQPRDISVPDEGLILNSGATQPFVVDFKINLFADETYILGGEPTYVIRLETAIKGYIIETGLFTSEKNPITKELHGNFSLTSSPPPPPPPSLPLPVPGDPGYSSNTGYSTYADSCVTVGGRTALIIDGFLDAILGGYRQLMVHDEHARRTGNDHLKLRLTYEYLNKFTTPEIFDGKNTAIPFDQVDFDFRNGVFSVSGDDGNQDYFVTYTFNFFPENVLRMFVQQTVSVMNFVGAGAGGGYITHYTTLEQTPPEWDGLIALGAAAIAWKRLATNIVLWKNWLIFEGDVGEGVQAPGGQTAMQAANDASQYYQTLFDTYAAATKFDRFVIGPTMAWEIFATTGFGSFGNMGVGTGNQIWEGKFRGLTINKSFSF